MTRKSFKDAVVDGWDALIPLVYLNVIWLVLTLIVITAFPAFGALYYATNRIAHGKLAGIVDFFEGFKKYFWLSWKWGLFTTLIYGVSVVNVWFYGQFEGFGYTVLQSLFFSLILMFSCMQIYVFPFLLEQKEPSLKTAIKNSFAVFIGYIGKSIGLFIFFIVLLVISVLLPPLFFLLTISVITYLSNWQTIDFIQVIKAGEEDKIEKQPLVG